MCTCTYLYWGGCWLGFMTPVPTCKKYGDTCMGSEGESLSTYHVTRASLSFSCLLHLFLLLRLLPPPPLFPSLSLLVLYCSLCLLSCHHLLPFSHIVSLSLLLSFSLPLDCEGECILRVTVPPTGPVPHHHFILPLLFLVDRRDVISEPQCYRNRSIREHDQQSAVHLVILYARWVVVFATSVH